MKKGLYEENGIRLSKSALRVGDEVTLTYWGLLKDSGARSVKVHIGYNETWENSAYIEMEPSDAGFTASIALVQAGVFHFAFIDPAGNWDNNTGKDYSIPVAAKKAARSSKSDPEGKKSGARAPKTAKAEGQKAVKATGATASEASKTSGAGTRKAASKTTREKKASGKASKPAASKGTQSVAASAGVATIKRGPGRPKKKA